MFIINKFNIFHDIPDDMPLPAGARRATAEEVADWQGQDAANKLIVRQQKQEAAQRRAQLVVQVAAPVEAQEPEKPRAKNDKPAA